MSSFHNNNFALSLASILGSRQLGKGLYNRHHRFAFSSLSIIYIQNDGTKKTLGHAAKYAWISIVEYFVTQCLISQSPSVHSYRDQVVLLHRDDKPYLIAEKVYRRRKSSLSLDKIFHYSCSILQRIPVSFPCLYFEYRGNPGDYIRLGCVYVSRETALLRPVIGSKAAGDLVLIQTSLLFLCKCRLVSITTTRFKW